LDHSEEPKFWSLSQKNAVCNDIAVSGDNMVVAVGGADMDSMNPRGWSVVLDVADADADATPTLLDQWLQPLKGVSIARSVPTVLLFSSDSIYLQALTKELQASGDDVHQTTFTMPLQDVELDSQATNYAFVAGDTVSSVQIGTGDAVSKKIDGATLTSVGWNGDYVVFSGAQAPNGLVGALDTINNNSTVLLLMLQPEVNKHVLASVISSSLDATFYIGGVFSGASLTFDGHKAQGDEHCDTMAFVAAATLNDTDQGMTLEWKNVVPLFDATFKSVLLLDVALDTQNDALQVLGSADLLSMLGNNTLTWFGAVSLSKLTTPPAPAAPVPGTPNMTPRPPHTPVPNAPASDVGVDFEPFDHLSATPHSDYIADATFVYIGIAVFVLCVCGVGYFFWRRYARLKPSEPNLHRFTHMEQQYGHTPV
jgi:hypothetical protein